MKYLFALSHSVSGSKGYCLGLYYTCLKSLYCDGSYLYNIIILLIYIYSEIIEFFWTIS